MSDYEYVSDNEEYVDYNEDSNDNTNIDDYLGADDVLIAPADPDEGIDESSEADNYSEEEPVAASDDEVAETPEEIEEEAEPIWIDPKTVSKYNKEYIVVLPENRRTSNVMSLFEMTDYVSIRAVQIANYANCMVDIGLLDDPIKMAKRELMMRKCPLILVRYVGDLKNKITGEIESYQEYWYPSEMTFATSYNDVI